MDFKRVQVVAYVVLKRLQGYQLLRNAKTSSPMEVTMLRRSQCMTYGGDLRSVYERIYHNFETKHKVKDYLSTVHFYSAKPAYKSYGRLTEPVTRVSKGEDHVFGTGDLSTEDYIKVYSEWQERQRHAFVRSNFLNTLRGNLAHKTK